MNSRHLTGDAVDVVAYVGGKVSWDFPFYRKISETFTVVRYRADCIVAFGNYVSLVENNTATPGTGEGKWQEFIFAKAARMKPRQVKAER